MDGRAVRHFVRRYGTRETLATLGDASLCVREGGLFCRTEGQDWQPACERCFVRRFRCRVADSRHPRFRLCTAHARQHLGRKKRRLAAKAEEGSQSHKHLRRVAEPAAPPASSAVQLWLARLATAEPFVEQKPGVRMLQRYGAAFRVLEGRQLVFKEWRGGQASADRPACESCYEHENLATLATVRRDREWPTVCARHGPASQIQKPPRQQGMTEEPQQQQQPSVPTPEQLLTHQQGGRDYQLRVNAGGALFSRASKQPHGWTQWAFACPSCWQNENTIVRGLHWTEDGQRRFKLCTKHSRLRGCYELRYPCEDCPADAKKHASFADEQGRSNRLCAKHAKERRCHEVQNPCEDCPSGSKKTANYADEQGRPRRLCAQHARERRCHRGRNLCDACPVGAEKEANYADERGRSRRLCAMHARERGCHETLTPCEACPAAAKKTAAYADEQGHSNRLCAEHAKYRGWYDKRNPCKACPEGARKAAAFVDELGRSNKLCAEHAVERDCYKMQHPCEACPQNAKTQPNYANEQGLRKRLCAKHAKECGCHQVLNPCQDCPADSKVDATFADEQGHNRRLCAEHAFARGLIPKPAAGCSIAACRLWDRLEQALGCQIQHKHFVNGATVPHGAEARVPGTKLLLDGYDAASNCVYEFHGNAYHGFPPGHPKYAEGQSPVSGRRNRDLYRETMARMYFVRRQMPTGCRVFYAWEHEYAGIKDKPLASAASILQELPPGEYYDGCSDDDSEEE